MKPQRTGAVLIIVAMMMFGFYGVALRGIQASALTVLFFNQVFGTIALFFVVVKQKGFKIQGFGLFITGLTIAAVLNDFMYFNALKLTTIANAVLTHYTAPIFVAILAPFFLSEKLTRKTLLALGCSFLGLVLILSTSSLTWNTNLAGILAGLASGFFYAVIIIAYKKATVNLSVYTINFYRYLLSTFLLLPFVFATGPTLSLGLLGKLALFALSFAVVAATLHIEGIKRVKAQHAGIFGYVEPLSAVLYGIFLLSELPSLLTVVGGLLILGSTYIVLSEKH